MATRTARLAFSLVTAALVAGPLAAADFAPKHQALAEGLRAQLGADHGLVMMRSHQDELGMSHARFQQTYKGIPVFGAQAITHLDKAGKALAPSQFLHRNINLNVTPALGQDEALAVAHREFAPKAAYKAAPKAELVIFPETTLVKVRPGSDATAYEERPVRYHLAYAIRAEVETAEQTAHRIHIVDAHTGALLKTIDDLHTAAANGTGNSQYSGTVSLSVNSTTSGYEMSEVTRSMAFKTYNLNHATSGTGTIYTDADNTWGDGANYVEGSSTTAANGQTAGVDAHYGTQVSFDFYKNLFGRNGIDGTGKASYNRVHYSNSYDNAFWSDSCFCMTYGDGSSFTTLTALDVAGHEMSHGVCANSANLTYSGESGGLNESDSDILGNMIELYSRNGNSLPATVANTNSCWILGEQLSSTPLRYMYKPSKDGSSPDAWSSTVGNLDVHYSSGPNNRMFFFLSQGATTSGDYSAPTYLPSGMTGVGPEKAVRIWYRALTVYLTSSSNYAAARTACINAAKDLYGAGSAAEAAVWNAYHGINVGSAWTGGGTTTMTASVSPSSTTVTSGGSVTFTGSAANGTSPYTYSWNFGDGTTGSGATVSHTFLNGGTTAITRTVTLTVTDSASHTASATATVTVNPAGSTGGTELIKNGGFESGATSWTQTSGVIGTYSGQPAHGGSYDAWMCGYGTTHTDYVSQTITVPAAGATLSFWLHIDSAETTTSTAYDKLQVQVINGTTTTTLATYSNLNKATGYAQKSFSLAAYAGKTITIKFNATEDSSLQTSFVVDDVSAK